MDELRACCRNAWVSLVLCCVRGQTGHRLWMQRVQTMMVIMLMSVDGLQDYWLQRAANPPTTGPTGNRECKWIMVVPSGCLTCAGCHRNGLALLNRCENLNEAVQSLCCQCVQEHSSSSAFVAVVSKASKHTVPMICSLSQSRVRCFQ